MASFLEILDQLTGGTPHWQAPPPPPTGPLSAGDVLGGLGGAGALETAKAVLSPIAAARLALETGEGMGKFGAGVGFAPQNRAIATLPDALQIPATLAATAARALPTPLAGTANALAMQDSTNALVQRASEVGIPQAIAAAQFEQERSPEAFTGQKFLQEQLLNPVSYVGGPLGKGAGIAARALEGAPRPVIAALEALAKGDTAYSEGVGLGFDALKQAIQAGAAKVPVARTLAQQSTKGGIAERANLVDTVARQGEALGTDLAPGEIPAGRVLQTLFGEQAPPKPPGAAPIDLLGDPIVPRTPNGTPPTPSNGTAAETATTLLRGTPTPARAEVTDLLGADRAQHYYDIAQQDVRMLRSDRGGLIKALGGTVPDKEAPIDLGALYQQAEAIAPIEESLYQRGIQGATPSRIQGAAPTIRRLDEALTARGATEEQVRTAQLRLLTERYGDTLPTTRDGENFTDAVRARLQQEGRLDTPGPNPLDAVTPDVPPGAPQEAVAAPLGAESPPTPPLAEVLPETPPPVEAPPTGATLADWSNIAGQTRPGQRAGIPPDLPPAQTPTTPGLPDAPDNLDQVRAALGLSPEHEAYFQQMVPTLAAQIEARGGEATDAALRSAALGEYARTVGGTWVDSLINSAPAKLNQEVMSGFRQQALAAPSSVVQDVIDASVKSLIMFQDLGWTKGQNPLTADILGMARDAWQRAARKAPEAAIGPVGDTLLSATAGVVPSSIIRDTITAGEQTAGKGLERLPNKAGGQYIRFWRELRTAVDESARTAAYTHGYRDYLASHADDLAAKLDAAVRPVLGDAIAQTVADGVRTSNGVFLPSTLRDQLAVEGAAPATIKDALTILGQERRAALEAGDTFAKKIHFDLMEGRTNADELLQQVTFFHTWATRNLPFYAEVLATHPGLFNALRAYQDTTAEGARQGDYSHNPRLRSGLPLGGPAELVAHLFGDQGQIFFNPARYIGIVQQLDEPYQARGQADMGSVINALSQVGLGPNPLIQAGLNTAGVMGARQPGNLLRVSPLINGLAQMATGLPVNIEDVTGLPQLQRMRPLNALGANQPVPSDPAQRVRMRLAQMAGEQGNPNDPAAIAAMREGASNPLWREAQHQMGIQRVLESLSSLAGAPMAIRTGAERAIDTQSGGLPDVNAAGGNRPYLPLIPQPNAQPGQPLMTYQQRDALLAQRAAHGLPLANAYQEALRRPAGEPGGGGGMDAALKAREQALLAEWATASPARKQAIADNPLDARLLADAFWQQGVNGPSHTVERLVQLLGH